MTGFLSSFPARRSAPAKQAVSESQLSFNFEEPHRKRSGNVVRKSVTVGPRYVVAFTDPWHKSSPWEGADKRCLARWLVY